MSRTYRCRHLPRVAHRSWNGRWAVNKVIDGGGHWRRYWKEIEEETTALVGYPKPDWRNRYGYTKSGTHIEVEILPMPKGWDKKPWNQKDLWGFPKRWEYQPEAKVEHIRKGVERPTQEAFEWERTYNFVCHNKVNARTSWHPYARKRNYHRYSYGDERRRANREMRRHNRQIIKANMVDDDFEGDWAEPDLYLDKRWFMD